MLVQFRFPPVVTLDEQEMNLIGPLYRKNSLELIELSSVNMKSVTQFSLVISLHVLD